MIHHYFHVWVTFLVFRFHKKHEFSIRLQFPGFVVFWAKRFLNFFLVVDTSSLPRPESLFFLPWSSCPTIEKGFTSPKSKSKNCRIFCWTRLSFFPPVPLPCNYDLPVHLHHGHLEQLLLHILHRLPSFLVGVVHCSPTSGTLTIGTVRITLTSGMNMFCTKYFVTIFKDDLLQAYPQSAGANYTAPVSICLPFRQYQIQVDHLREFPWPQDDRLQLLSSWHPASLSLCPLL